MEKYAERGGKRQLKKLGYETAKIPGGGFPDTLVLLGYGLHFWIEWKDDPASAFTPAQKRRIPALRAQGELVAVLTGLSDVIAVARAARRSLLESTDLPPEFFREP